MPEIINLDDSVESSDWLRSRTWDLPAIRDLRTYMMWNGISTDDLRTLHASIRKDEGLPYWQAAPKALLLDVDQFKRTGSLAHTSADPNPSGAAVTTRDGVTLVGEPTKKQAMMEVYTTARAQMESEIAVIEMEISKILKAKSLWARQKAVQYQDAIAAHYAPQVAKAMRDSYTGVDAAISEAMANYKTATKAAANPNAAADAASRAVNNHVKITPEHAKKVINYIYGNGFATGTHASMSLIGEDAIAPPDMSEVLDGLDWDTWEPTDRIADLLLRDEGFIDLMDSAGLSADTIATDVTETGLMRLGNTLARGMAEGLPAEAIARSIEDQVEGNALTIALTETARAQSAATMITYDENGIEQYNWLAEDDACDKCRSYADGGPYTVPPGGDYHDVEPSQPEHPNCRCCYLPVIMVGGVNIAPTSNEGDQAVNPPPPAGRETA